MENQNLISNEDSNLNSENQELNNENTNSSADKILDRINKLKKTSETEVEKEAAKIVEETTEAKVISESENITVAQSKENSFEAVDTENENDEESELTEDYSNLERENLLHLLKDIIEKEDILKSFNKVKALKDEFFYKTNKEIKETKEKFLASGGEEKSFEYIKTELENNFAIELEKYFEKRNQLKEKEEEHKKQNLKLKYEVIEGIQNLINKPESFETTYNNFKLLQQKWRETGLVPKENLKQLWDDYHREVDNFYKYLEINKELRDLDLKKNLNEKLKLCEQAEELLTEQNITNARGKLQDLHKMWKETGPVSNEKKDEIWDRFRSATININKRFQENLDKIKEQQEKNLESKTFLCEKAEEYSIKIYNTHTEWKDASNQVIKLQALWKNIGFVPQNKNVEIYRRFRAACDIFFENIRNFYSKVNEERDNNMQLKIDLCIQAESLQESNEWKKTSEIYKNLQSEWKTIGPVNQKKSEEIWQRFRKACNIFFERKKAYFTTRKTNETENLERKKALIEEIKNFEPENTPADIEKLKEFQRMWTEIGFVPFDQKDIIYKEYRDIINGKFDLLNIDRSKQDEIYFNEKINTLKNSKNSQDLFSQEATKLQNKIEKIESDIKILENNLGFFANSKNAETMISDFNKKIENSKSEAEKLKAQLKKLLQEV